MSGFPHDGFPRLRANIVSYLVSDSKEVCAECRESTRLDGVLNRGKTKRPKPFWEPGTHRLNSPPRSLFANDNTGGPFDCE